MRKFYHKKVSKKRSKCPTFFKFLSDLLGLLGLLLDELVLVVQLAPQFVHLQHGHRPYRSAGGTGRSNRCVDMSCLAYNTGLQICLSSTNRPTVK